MSLNLLQMGESELEEYIKSSSEKNPMIEISYEDHPSHGGRFSSQSPDLSILETIGKEEANLHNTLLDQVDLSEVSTKERAILEYLIFNLDDRGYLPYPLEELSLETGISSKQLQKALETLQSLDPSGIGARNLEECLILQLKRLGKYTPAYVKLLHDHLHLVQIGNYAAIAAQLNITAREARQMCAEIKKLDPYPGNQLTSDAAPDYVIPDAEIISENGQLKIILNETALSSFTISDQYQALLTSSDDAELISYLTKQLKEAKWLKRSVLQRKMTLEKILTFIAETHKAFFLSQKLQIKSLPLSLISESVHLHESTISRAIKNKYISCPCGTLPLRYFVGGCGGLIGIRLLQIVKNEDSANPLSDQQLAMRLTDDGIAVPRRTIAKYRSLSNIPNSRQRKRIVR